MASGLLIVLCGDKVKEQDKWIKHDKTYTFKVKKNKKKKIFHPFLID